MNLSQYIDHTLLKPVMVQADVEKLCRDALQYRFAAVCVPPYWVNNAVQLLQNSAVKVATVIGFPFGYSHYRAKLTEVQQAIADGAHELDVVINISALKNGDRKYLQSEMQTLLEPIRAQQRLVKVIIESGVLTDAEIDACCTLYGGLGADFLKTSTGYAEKGVTVEAVQRMRRQLPSTIRIKASGGIRSYQQAVQLIEAGADRLGCSASVAIVTGGANKNAGGY